MNDFKFHLFSPHYVPESRTKLFNDVYQIWKKTFAEVVESRGGKLDPDDFFRGDYIAAISKDDQVVCICLLSVFDLKLTSSKEHHYIRTLNDSTINKLISKNQSRIMSLEYLNVLPEWRKHNSEVNWAEVMLGLGNKLMDQSVADGLIGMPRIDRKVDEVLLRLGAYPIQDPVDKMGYPCAILFFDKQKNRHFDNLTIEKYVQSLWRDKEMVGETFGIDRFQYQKTA